MGKHHESGIPWLGKRGNTFYAFWQDTGRGRQGRFSLRTRDAHEAKNRFAAFLIEGKDVYSGETALGADTMTCEVAFEHYLDEHVDVKCSDVGNPRKARDYTTAFFGDTPIPDISIQDCRDYAKTRRAGKVGRPSVNSTITTELRYLRAAINHEVRWKRLPSDLAPFIEVPGTNGARERWLTYDELEKLRAAADDRTRLFIDLAYYTASRRRALEELTWFQVKLPERKIYLNPEGRRQTKKRRPVVPIVNGLYAVLKPEFDKKGTGYVLGDASSAYRGFKDAVKAAGLPDKPNPVSPHTLRHTRGVHLAQKGVSIYAIAGLLGDTIATTEQNYLHHCPDHIRAEIEGRSDLTVTAAELE